MPKVASALANYLWDASTQLPERLSPEEAVPQILAAHEVSGGATISLFFGDMAGQSLYAVALFPERALEIQGADVPEDLLQAFLTRNSDLLADPRNCVGTWYDTEFDVTYLDVATVLPDEQVAAELGRRYNQRAIYDLGNEAEIPTGGDGRVLFDWPPESERLPLLERGRA